MAQPLLTAGEPAPWFTGRTSSNPTFHFDTVAGRYVVLAFLGSAADAGSREILEAIAAQRQRFDDTNLCFFGVSIDPDDERLGRITDSLPGIRFFMDDRGEISRAFRVPDDNGTFRRIVYILDPGLRVLSVIPFPTETGTGIARLTREIGDLPKIGEPVAAATQAPVLVVPRIFEPELCGELIETYERRGGTDSGFMRDVEGKTKLIVDYGHKRRRDCMIEDEALRTACMVRIHDRLAPEIFKAFQFRATRMERHLIACYDANEGGHFRPHRDNTTKGTAHRRFAVSLFLNTGEYKGGALHFPEYGPMLYGTPTGGAVVFSCSMLHEATAVTSGRRFMYLPFLYDDAAAKLREANRQYLDESLRGTGSESQ